MRPFEVGLWLIWSLKYNVLFFLVYRVSLEDLYNGKTTKLQLSKNVLCGACNG